MTIPKMTSSEFRRTYGKLEEPTFVTVSGHIIGTWVPLMFDRPVVGPTVDVGLDDFLDVVVHQPHVDGTPAKEAQANRDAILRRINKGG